MSIWIDTFAHFQFLFLFVCSKYVNETKLTELTLSFCVALHTPLSILSVYLFNMWGFHVNPTFSTLRTLIVLVRNMSAYGKGSILLTYIAEVHRKGTSEGIFVLLHKSNKTLHNPFS